MAAAAGSLAELDCPICLDPYDLVTRTPRFLPCHHSLCHSCLHSLIDRRQTQGAIKCPLCQKIALVPTERAFGFQVNFYLERRLATPSERQSQRTESLDRCTEMNRNETAKSGCFHVEVNKRNDLPAMRKSVSVSDFSSLEPYASNTCSNCRRLSVQSSASTTNITDDGCLQIRPLAIQCAKHPREELVLYCKQCKIGICIICKMTLHERHPSDDLADVATTVRQHLRTEVGQLQTSYRMLQDQIQRVQERKRDYLLKVKVIRENILTKKEEMSQDLTNRTDHILDGLNAIQTERGGALDAEVALFQEKAQKTSDSVTYLSELLTSSNNMDVITYRNRSKPYTPVSQMEEDPRVEYIPVLLSHRDDMVAITRQFERVVNIRKYPTLMMAQQIKCNRLVSARTGLWVVTDTDVRRMGLNGETGDRIRVTGIVDAASSSSGTIYLLLQQNHTWHVKSIELNSFLAEFMDLPAAVDKITCCHDNSVVLGRAGKGKLSLEYYGKDRKWLRTVQVPWRHIKLDDLVGMPMEHIAVLSHKSEWTSEIMILSSGGQRLHRFTGSNIQGCNVNSMLSVGGGFLIHDLECGHVVLLDSACDILCHVIRKERVREWVQSRVVDSGLCAVQQMTLGEDGLLWLLCKQGQKQTLCAVHWND